MRFCASHFREKKLCSAFRPIKYQLISRTYLKTALMYRLHRSARRSNINRKPLTYQGPVVSSRKKLVILFLQSCTVQNFYGMRALRDRIQSNVVERNPNVRKIFQTKVKQTPSNDNAEKVKFNSFSAQMNYYRMSLNNLSLS